MPIGIPGESTFRAPPRADLESGLIDVNIVSANYFDAMGMTLVAGQLFDAERRGCRIGVLNEEAAARFFGGHAIGGAVIDANGVRTEIVGVVRSPLLRTEQRLAEPALFVPMSQDLLPRMTALLVHRRCRRVDRCGHPAAHRAGAGRPAGSHGRHDPECAFEPHGVRTGAHRDGAGGGVHRNRTGPGRARSLRRHGGFRAPAPSRVCGAAGAWRTGMARGAPVDDRRDAPGRRRAPSPA